MTTELDAVRFRARDLGIEPGIYLPGKHNAITDVHGVLVGHKTVWKDPPAVPTISHRVRSGVTAILPHSGNISQQKVPCAIYLGNAFGKLVGYTQVKELGTLETPILLTSTLNVSKVADALIAHTLRLAANKTADSINPVVGETNDGELSDSRSRPVEEKDVFDALRAARGGLVLEGSVGAGTGTRCLGWKGGIGTASRVLPPEAGGYTVGVLVQTNFGGLLTVNGAPVGRELGRSSYSYELSHEAGSCMIVAATDAPLCSRNLERLAKRAVYGLVRCGSYSSNESGDYAIAFSTAYTMPYTEPVQLLNNVAMSRLFLAIEEATEEAVLNSMLQATTVTGRDDHSSETIPLADVIGACRKYDSLFWHSKVAPWAPTTKEGTIADGGRRLKQLMEHVSSAHMSHEVKSSLLAKLNGAIENNSDAYSLTQQGREQQANEALLTCASKIKMFTNELATGGLITEPHASLFALHADLGEWICQKARAA